MFIAFCRPLFCLGCDQFSNTQLSSSNFFRGPVLTILSQGTFTWNNLSVSSTLQSEQLTQYKSNFTGMWTYVNEAVGCEYKFHSVSLITNKHLDPSMSDIMQSSTSASSYASTVSSAIDALVTNVTSWLNLPDNVAMGLKSQYQIQQEWLNEEIGQLEIVLTLLGNGGNEIGIQVALQHPFSRGTIFINSTDPFIQPNINPDYFGVGYDIDIMGYGSDFARRLAAASPLSEVLITETAPGPTVTGDSLATYTKQKCGTEYHPLGTCSMLPKDSGGVVDTTLTVYGTSNLRVVDVSIAPLQLSAHLMATTYGIAEKGADIIKKKYWYVEPVTSSTAATATASEPTTAAIGDATDTAVTNVNQNNAESGSTLSSGAKIGIGVGVGVGAAAILAGLLLFFLMRKRNQKQDEKGWYNDRQAGWNPDAAGGQLAFTKLARRYTNTVTAYKEPGPAYPMADFDSHDSYASPTPAFIGNHSRNQSINTIATADLASRTPIRNSSSFSYAAGGLDVGRAASPYRDDMSEDGNGQGHVYQGPGAPAGPQATRAQQRYHPVNIR